MRRCDWCKETIPETSRSDAKTCSKKCRQAKHRFRVSPGPRFAGTQPMRFAYADPPYPGMARRYYGPEAQEVNHRVLIGTLERDYPDGWALSTSAAALPGILALCPPGARVCPWVRGSRRSVAYRPRTAWEPLIVVGGRAQVYEVEDICDDVLIWGGRQHSHPEALIGMKSAAFLEWMFRMLGAGQGDVMDDIFPGSGATSRAWKLYTSRLPGGDPSEADAHDASPRGNRDTLLERDATSSRLAEAQTRLDEQLNASSETRRGGTAGASVAGVLLDTTKVEKVGRKLGELDRARSTQLLLNPKGQK